MSQASTTASPDVGLKSRAEVLTLEEAAAYLRVSESDVVDLVTRHELPGRRIGEQWRFHRMGLINWLVRPSAKQRLLRHAGAMKDDPDLEPMLEKIYQDRGRSMTEDAE